jgi:hypothetical protein
MSEKHDEIEIDDETLELAAGGTQSADGHPVKPVNTTKTGFDN